MSWFGDTKRGRFATFLGNDPTLAEYLQLSSSSIDNSGNGLNGSDTNIVYDRGGRFGGGAHFEANGSTSHITTSFAVGGRNQISMGGWFKPLTASTTGNGIIVNVDNTGAFYIGTYASGAWTVQCYNGTTGVNTPDVVAANPTLGVWHFIVATYDGVSTCLYIDGKLVAAIAGPTGNIVSGATQQWGANNGGSSPYVGYMEDVFYMTRPLTEAQIAQYWDWATKKKSLTWRRAFQAGTVYTLTAVQGAYIYTGFAITFIKNLGISLVRGSYALTGFTVSLLKTTAMAVTQGLYSLTGFAVTVRNKSWAFRTKHPASWSNKAKNAASWFFRNKS